MAEPPVRDPSMFRTVRTLLMRQDPRIVGWPFDKSNQYLICYVWEDGVHSTLLRFAGGPDSKNWEPVGIGPDGLSVSTLSSGTGTAGAAGAQGAQGPKGDKGDTGDVGPQGLPGSIGLTGPQGPQGAQGPQGNAGATGSQGPKGDTGETGAQGIPGTAGSTGTAGAAGSPGATGPAGPAPSGTGYVKVTAGSLDTPSATVPQADVAGLVAALGLKVGAKAGLAASKLIANTLTQVVGFTAPANTLAVGTVVRFRGMGLLTNTTAASTSVLTLRINAASLGAVIEASWQVALGTAARTNCPFMVEADLVVMSTGAGGTAWGVIAVVVNTTTAIAVPATQVAAAVACNTTQANVVELTCISGATTTTWNFISATIEVIQP